MGQSVTLLLMDLGDFWRLLWLFWDTVQQCPQRFCSYQLEGRRIKIQDYEVGNFLINLHDVLINLQDQTCYHGWGNLVSALCQPYKFLSHWSMVGLKMFSLPYCRDPVMLHRPSSSTWVRRGDTWGRLSGLATVCWVYHMKQSHKTVCLLCDFI